MRSYRRRRRTTTSAAAVLDPTTLALSLWVRGSYAFPTWTSEASAGLSGGRTLGAGSPPAAGVALDGYTPADLNGTTDYFSFGGALATSDLVSTTGWRVSLLMYADAAAAPAAVYLDAGILADGGGNWGIGFSTDGIVAYQYDGGTWKSAKCACSTGAWHSVDAIYDGVNITVSVDGVAGTPTPSGNGAGFSSGVFVGKNYSGAAFFNGKIMEMRTAKVHLSSTSADDIMAYDASRYPSAGL